MLGESGNPGEPAAALLVALGIEPAAEGSQKAAESIRAQLDELRLAAFSDPDAREQGSSG